MKKQIFRAAAAALAVSALATSASALSHTVVRGDTMWKLAERPGRFICEEKPLISYRIHSGATTKECIENHRRVQEEEAMFRKIWPDPVVRVIMWFYRKAYRAYQ